MSGSEDQFFLARVASSTSGRARNQIPTSEINSLEHHGLNRCLDVGLPGYLRYVGYGVMSYNLHVIGRELLAREWTRAKPARLAA